MLIWPACFAGGHGTAAASPCCMRGDRGSSEEQEAEITKGRQLEQGIGLCQWHAALRMRACDGVEGEEEWRGTEECGCIKGRVKALAMI